MILLDGKKLSDKLYGLLEDFPDKSKYKLFIITIGDDAASKVYVKNKIKACEKVGIACENVAFSSNISPADFGRAVENIVKSFYALDSDYRNGGVILQLPAPKKYVDILNDYLAPQYDVDGLGDTNQAMLMTGEVPYHYPATPKGIMTLLNNYNIEIEGKHVVIVGRSEIVGKPLAQMMLDKNATVTICHSKTPNLSNFTCIADILIVAVGKPKFIKASDVKWGAVVIDVGINKTEDGLCGDVDFYPVAEKCYAITPVPGGVGPMTVYSLIENVLMQ